jgi:glutamate-1-semialdehyde 2,1-aminomutase
MSIPERFERLLQSFVPPGVFDAHAHLFPGPDAPPSVLHCLDGLDDSSNLVTAEVYTRHVQSWMGDRTPRAGLFFGFPGKAVDFRQANRFVAEQARMLPGSRALMLIRPGDDPVAVEVELREGGFAGFKVYHVYATRADTFNAALDEFLPEWAWELADRHRLAIMLHIVRARALADEENQRYIREHAQRYPDARLILAHAGRGFCGRHTVEGISAVRGLDNVFFDTSAICEPPAFEVVLRKCGPTRLLFGTDFPVSEMLGRCVSIDDGFLWLDSTANVWENSAFAQPTRVGLESLLALQQACRTERLNDRDIERIFRENARELFGTDHTAPDRPDAPGTAATGDPSRRDVQAVYTEAKQLIPGGTQLLSKRPEMFAPDQWPAYYREARGCEVVDFDERPFIDMTHCGVGSCLLGYADPDVVDAVVRRVQLGSMCTLNNPEEVELARLLIDLHPWAEQVRYCRTGGEAMAMAVRIARAATGRDRVAFCGYHGWSDWYLSANLPESSQADGNDRLQGHLLPGLEPAGVPTGLSGTALPFNFQQIDELRAHVRDHGGNLAAVVMEPTRSVHPQPGFLEDVRQICDDCGAALVFDEITTGWRLHLGGVHLKYGVSPDVVVFAKALGNGHPMAAVLGRSRIMQAAQTSFISSTYWTEGVGPTAALAAVRKMQTVDVPAHVERIGDRFRHGWQTLGQEHGVPATATGHPALLHLGFDHPEAAALGTLLTVRMLQRGYLTGSGFYPTWAHHERHVDRYFKAAEPVFAELAQAVVAGDIRQRIGGPVRHGGFARLT